MHPIAEFTTSIYADSDFQWGSLKKAILKALCHAIRADLVVHIAEDYKLLHSTSTKSSPCTCSISMNSCTLYHNTGRAHTSCTHFNWIFEIVSSLRHNYALHKWWHNAFKLYTTQASDSWDTTSLHRNIRHALVIQIP